MKHFGKKVEYNGYKFDSIKEKDFYSRFCEKFDREGSEFKIIVHPSYDILDKFEIDGVNFRNAKYTPDFVITDQQGNLKHVYDVKNGFSSYVVDAAAKLRFKLFEKRYGVPVECVVVLKNSFKVKVFGTTKMTKIHVFEDFDYDWRSVL